MPQVVSYLPRLRTEHVSGLGGDCLRDGSYDYYISEPRAVNNQLGIGAFMMAAAELEMRQYAQFNA